MADKRIVDLPVAGSILSTDIYEKSDAAGTPGESKKASHGQLLTYMQNNLTFPSTGVTSVAATFPSGWSVTGSPITSAGTLAVSTSWNINKPRVWTTTVNIPYPVTYTNNTANDLSFVITAFLTNSRGQSTTINISVGGMFVSQITNVCTSDVTFTAGTQPLGGVIVPPGASLHITLVGEAQAQGPFLSYIST